MARYGDDSIHSFQCKNSGSFNFKEDWENWKIAAKMSIESPFLKQIKTWTIFCIAPYWSERATFDRDKLVKIQFENLSFENCYLYWHSYISVEIWRDKNGNSLIWYLALAQNAVCIEMHNIPWTMKEPTNVCVCLSAKKMYIGDNFSLRIASNWRTYSCVHIRLIHKKPNNSRLWFAQHNFLTCRFV